MQSLPSSSTRLTVTQVGGSCPRVQAKTRKYKMQNISTKYICKISSIVCSPVRPTGKQHSKVCNSIVFFISYTSMLGIYHTVTITTPVRLAKYARWCLAGFS